MTAWTKSSYNFYNGETPTEKKYESERSSDRSIS